MKFTPQFVKACENQGLDAEKIMPDLSMYPEKHRAALDALAQLLILSDDANKDFVADWNDNNQRKYGPWIDMEETEDNPSGFRFIAAGYGSSFTAASLGSRLSFPNAQEAEKFFEDNKELYKALLTIPKTK